MHACDRVVIIIITIIIIDGRKGLIAIAPSHVSRAHGNATALLFYRGCVTVTWSYPSRQIAIPEGTD